MNIAFITGVNGQDGSYLAEFLLQKNYAVWGTTHGSCHIGTSGIEAAEYQQLKNSGMTCSSNLHSALNEIKEKYSDFNRLEIYNLAAMSHADVSYALPEYTGDVDGLEVTRLLEAARLSGLKDKIYLFQASASELYGGKVLEIPQTEKTPFHPRSPYGVAKLYAYWITVNYREVHGMHCSNGILFDHDSPRRDPTFVTKKITLGLKNILNGTDDKLMLGNLDSTGDWGHAKDYVEGMWKMLQKEKPGDYILATGNKHSVREFVEKAFLLRGFDIQWKGYGVNEVGVDTKTKKELVFVSEKHFRSTEVDHFWGDASKANAQLGWYPRFSFDELVKDMVDADCPLRA